MKRTKKLSRSSKGLIKKLFAAVTLLTLMLTLLVGCSGAKQDGLFEVTSLDDLDGRECAVLTGAVTDEYLHRRVPGALVKWYNDPSSMVSALRAGQVDAYVSDEPTIRIMMAENPDFMMMPEVIEEDTNAFGFTPGRDDLIEPYNEMLAELEESGELRRMQNRWFRADPADRLPDQDFAPATGKNGTLNFAAALASDPFSYVYMGETVGYEVELAQRFAQYMDMELKVHGSEFGAVIPSIVSGKCDFGGGCMSVTEERKKNIDFANPNFYGGIRALVRKPAELAAVPSITELQTSRVGVMTGTTGELLMKSDYPDANIMVYDNIMDGILALQSGQLDFVVTSYTTAITAKKKNSSVVVLPDELYTEGAAIATNKNSSDLLAQINSALAKLKEDGRLEALISRWIKSDGSDYTGEPTASTVTSGEPIIIGTAANREPMCFIENGNFTGLDIELITLIANEIGRPIEFSDMNFAALIPSLTAGKVDAVIANMTPTPERLETVDFSNDYFTNPQVAMTMTTGAATDISFWDGLKKSFVANFITEHRWSLLLEGLAVTVLISIGSAFFGTLLGFAICMMRMNKSKWLQKLATGYINIVRGIPNLVLLMLIYYVVLAKVGISPVLVSIITFSINFSAYVSEIMRTAIEGVDKGQVEAASAIGFTKAQTFLNITLPQATRMALPVYTGEFVSMVKSTSIVGYVAIMDLTKASDLIRARTFEAAFPLIVIALIYLLLTNIAVWLLSRIEKSIDPKRRKREVKF